MWVGRGNGRTPLGDGRENQIKAAEAESTEVMEVVDADLFSVQEEREKQEYEE